MRRLSEERRGRLRAWGIWATTAGAAIALLGSGCATRKERLRPIYTVPATAAPCPVGDPGCNSTSGSSTQIGAPIENGGFSLPSNAAPSKSGNADEPGLNLNGSG